MHRNAPRIIGLTLYVILDLCTRAKDYERRLGCLAKIDESVKKSGVRRG